MVLPTAPVPNTSQNASLLKMRWSHFDLAILYKAVYPLREAPSVPSKVSYFHYATPLCAIIQQSLAVEAY